MYYHLQAKFSRGTCPQLGYKGGKVRAAGWQVTLCDPIWHVISRSSEVISITNCYILFTLVYIIGQAQRMAKDHAVV